MEWQQFFAGLAWVLLSLVMLIRPLAQVVRWSGWRSFLRYRRELGVAAGWAAIIHVFLYVYLAGFDYHFWLGPVWNFNSLLGWGMLALIFMLPPLVCSNCFSQKVLKRYWKSVQRLSYLTFVFTAVHVSFVPGWFWWGMGPLLVWIVVWVGAEVKKQLRQ